MPATPTAYELSADDTVLADHIERADTYWKRGRGLAGRASLPAGHGLWIKPCSSIHMFGMRFAIDAVFINRQNEVTRIHLNLAPWRIAFGGKGAHSVIELPAGTLPPEGLPPGTRLQLKEFAAS
jgi:uncharacterized membrane protein (UPF0127 family)